MPNNGLAGLRFGDEPWRNDRMHNVRMAILPQIAQAKTWQEVELGCLALLTASLLSTGMDDEAKQEGVEQQGLARTQARINEKERSV